MDRDWCIPAAELTELCQVRVVSRIFNVALQHRLQADVDQMSAERAWFYADKVPPGDWSWFC